jgi:2-dehydro-3-deoxyphosphogluconate aldolase/(4S)-4-hydroxy-2-oxoglutarate aldolase
VSAEALRTGPAADAIRRHRLIAVLRRIEPRDALLELVDELAAAGVHVFEITLDAPTGEADLAAVRALLHARHPDDRWVGAGTVLRGAQLEAAARADADFVVAPVFDADLVRAAIARGLPAIPGALTPTEIAAAWDAGATFVKLFPASALGPALVRELRGPLPEVELIPTGGIDAATAGDFLEAGAVAAGVGGAIVRADPAERRALVAAVRGQG